jgi:hypothetical protein
MVPLPKPVRRVSRMLGIVPHWLWGGGEFDQLKSGRGLSPLGLALSAGVVA